MNSHVPVLRPATQMTDLKSSVPVGDIMLKKKNRFPLTFPEGMHEQIAAHAKANFRTMNAEVIFRLESVEALQLEVNRLNQALDLFVQPLLESAHGQ